MLNLCSQNNITPEDIVHIWEAYHMGNYFEVSIMGTEYWILSKYETADRSSNILIPAEHAFIHTAYGFRKNEALYIRKLNKHNIPMMAGLTMHTFELRSYKRLDINEIRILMENNNFTGYIPILIPYL